jgi:hypothetical protein
MYVVSVLYIYQCINSPPFIFLQNVIIMSIVMKFFVCESSRSTSYYYHIDILIYSFETIIIEFFLFYGFMFITFKFIYTSKDNVPFNHRLSPICESRSHRDRKALSEIKCIKFIKDLSYVFYFFNPFLYLRHYWLIRTENNFVIFCHNFI